MVKYKFTFLIPESFIVKYKFTFSVPASFYAKYKSILIIFRQKSIKVNKNITTHVGLTAISNPFLGKKAPF